VRALLGDLEELSRETAMMARQHPMPRSRQLEFCSMKRFAHRKTSKTEGVRLPRREIAVGINKRFVIIRVREGVVNQVRIMKVGA